MKKKEFLSELEKRLAGLPKADIDERLEFYSEMIDDRVEEGKTEEEAIRDIGSIDEVVDQIAQDTPLAKLVKERMRPKKKVSPLVIVLLILGFPLWLPLFLVLIVLGLVFCLVLWILVIAAYAVEVGLLGYGIVGLISFFAHMSQGEVILLNLAVSLLGFGGTLVFFFVCIAATKLNAKITKKVLVGFKRLLIGGGKKNAQA